MTRLLLAAATAAGLLAAVAPASQACDLQHCPGTSIVCSKISCSPARCFDTGEVRFCV